MPILLPRLQRQELQNKQNAASEDAASAGDTYKTAVTAEF